MLLEPGSGVKAQTPEEAEALVNGGYKKCYNPQCNFHLSPETQQTVVANGGGYYTCPNAKCKQSHDLMEDLPWHGASDEQAQYNEDKFQQERYEPTEETYKPGFSPGGTTRIGLSLQEQAQIGEDVIEHLGSLPGYGPIVWWHQGGATEASPLDGATKEWGLEVKTIGYDATHHRFIPGRTYEKEAKNKQAEEMGLKGILGILVLLNYRTSEADVYVKEMPLTPWQNSKGRELRGVASFRSQGSTHLLERVKFNNPFMNPTSNTPAVAEDDLPF
jgi:hypothetical protein